MYMTHLAYFPKIFSSYIHADWYNNCLSVYDYWMSILIKDMQFFLIMYYDFCLESPDDWIFYCKRKNENKI